MTTNKISAGTIARPTDPVTRQELAVVLDRLNLIRWRQEEWTKTRS